jgi:TP901 family phage tail tape measure protein
MALTAGAIRAGRAYVELAGDDTKLIRALSRASSKVKAFGAATAAAGKSMMVGAAAIAAGPALMAKQFVSFERQMSRVKAISGATGKDFTALWNEAKRLGETTVFTASDAAEAMGNFALAGFSVDEILRATGPTLDMAAAGQLSMAEAADITAKVMRGLGIEAKDVGFAVDVLTRGMTRSNTDLRMLGEAFKYVGPMAAGVEKDITEMTASIMALSDAGIQADMAGTTMRGALLTLSDAKDQAKLRELGVEVLDASGKMKHLADIVDDFNAALQGAGSGQKLGVVGSIFDARQAAGFIRLLDVGGKKLRETEAMLKASAGTGRQIASTMMDNIHGDAKILESVWEGLALMFTETFGGKIREGIQWLSGVVSSITAWVRENHKLAGSLASTAMKVVAVTLAVGAVVFIVGKVIALIGTLIAVAKVLWVALTASPLVFAGLMAVVLAIQHITSSANMASVAATQLADEMTKLRDAGDRARRTDQLRMQRLEQLAAKQNLSNDETKEARELLAALEQKYGPLGAQIDSLTGKINNWTAAQEKANAAMTAAALQQVDAEIAERQRNVQRLTEELRKLDHGTQQVKNDDVAQWRRANEDIKQQQVLLDALARRRAVLAGEGKGGERRTWYGTKGSSDQLAAAQTGELVDDDAALKSRIDRENGDKVRNLEAEAQARADAKSAAEELGRLEEAAYTRRMDQLARERHEAQAAATERHRLLDALAEEQRLQKGGPDPKALADVERRRALIAQDLAYELADIERRAAEEQTRLREESARIQEEADRTAVQRAEQELELRRQVAEAEGDRAEAARLAAEQFRRQELARLDGLGLTADELAQATALIDRLAAARGQLDASRRADDERDLVADLDRQLAEQRGDKAALARLDAEAFRREQLGRLKDLDLPAARAAAVRDQVERIARGIEERATTERSVRGTFNAAAVQGLQVSSPERETARNTKRMGDSLERALQMLRSLRLFG